MTEPEAISIIRRYESLLAAAVAPNADDAERNRAMNRHRLTVVDGRAQIIDLEVDVQYGDYFIEAKPNRWIATPWK